MACQGMQHQLNKWMVKGNRQDLKCDVYAWRLANTLFMLTDQLAFANTGNVADRICSQLRICKTEVAELKTEKYKVAFTINDKNLENNFNISGLPWNHAQICYQTWRLANINVDWQVFTNLLQNNVADIYIQILVKPYGTNPMHDISQFY